MNRKLIDADHFKNFVNLSGFQKHGKDIIFSETKVDYENNGYVTDLALLHTGDNRIEKLLEGYEIGICHELDEKRLVFTANVSKEAKKLEEKGVPVTEFYVFNTKEKTKPEFLFRILKNVSDFARITEKKWLILCSDFLQDDDYWKQAEGNPEKFACIKDEEKDYFVAEEVPYWTNASGYCSGKRGRLFLYEDGEMTQLTPDNLSITALDTFEEKYAIYCGVESGSVQNTLGKLYRYDIPENKVEALDESETYLYTLLQALSETEILVCRSDRKLHGEYQDEYIDRINLKTGEFVRKNPKGDYHIYDNVVCDMSHPGNWLNKIQRAENGIYFIATEMESSKVFFWADEEELPKAVTVASGKVIDYEIINNRLYMAAMRELGGCEMYVQDLDGKEETRLTEYNTALDEKYLSSPVCKLNFINQNNVEIQGWYIKPTEFEEGKKYPTILFIHGGPQCAFGEIFNHDMQLAAAKGYGVIFCNPTGSEGRGGDFADIRMKYGTVDYDDFIAFTKHAVRTQDWIDADRLGVTGGSYGGIMTNWIIGHTDMFRAAVSDRGVCNNISDFGLSDIGVSFGLDTFETTPWGNIDFLWETSALKYAPQMKTPVLLIHGMDDYRCPYDSALQMHTALTYFGTPSKVFAFREENHELCRSGQPKHRTRRLEETFKWFEQYLK